jgi:hypothetical protein
MPHIRKFSHTKHVQSAAEYAALWHRMFDNARAYNRTESIIYQKADHLQGVLDRKLQELTEMHCVPGP